MPIEHPENPGLDPWLEANLVCPRDRGELATTGEFLVCPSGHRYPIVLGVPVMLVSESPVTHHQCEKSLRLAGQSESLSVPETADSQQIDPFVQKILVGTCGKLYSPLMGRLTAYPIPELRLPRSDGRLFLELGCNWGRWCIAAARAGYAPVGIDPSLEGVLAARRVSAQLGITGIRYVVGDARHLPFRDGQFDVVFSYSVLQHFSKSDVRQALHATRRVLRPDGETLVQMPNRIGVRSIFNQLRNFRDRGVFRVRYWTVGELQSAFGQEIGPSSIEVDGFFSLNAQEGDLSMLPFSSRVVVRTSARLRGLSQRLPFLRFFADSLYVRSHRAPR